MKTGRIKPNVRQGRRFTMSVDFHAEATSEEIGVSLHCLATMCSGKDDSYETIYPIENFIIEERSDVGIVTTSNFQREDGWTHPLHPQVPSTKLVLIANTNKELKP